MHTWFELDSSLDYFMLVATDKSFSLAHLKFLCMQEGELEELEKGVEPAWERLVHPLNCIVDRLNVVDHIKAVKDSPDLRAAVEDIQVVSSSGTPPVIWMDEAIDLLAHHQMLSLYFFLLHELSSNMVHR